MKARVLPYESWDRLPEYMDAVLMEARPAGTRICVVEDERGEIVARWLLYPVCFAEDLWVAPQYRQKVSVGRKLWRLVHRAAAELGYKRMVSTALDPEILGLLAHPSMQAEVMPGPMVTFPVRGM